MLIAQADPVLAFVALTAILAAAASFAGVFIALNRSHKLLIRILDTASDLGVAISRLEQVQQAGNASSAELRRMAATVSKAISRPGLDIDSLLSDLRPAGSATEANDPSPQHLRNVKI